MLEYDQAVPGGPGVVHPAVDPGGPLERGLLPEQWDKRGVAHDPLVDLGPHGRPAIAVGLGQGVVDQPVHRPVVVLAEVGIGGRRLSYCSGIDWRALSPR